METGILVHKASAALFSLASLVMMLPHLVFCQQGTIDPIAYLTDFGYIDKDDLPDASTVGGGGESAFFANKAAGGFSMSKAIKEYQQTYGLPVTGVVDAKTRELMNRTRCGVPDKVKGVKFMRPGSGQGAPAPSGLHTTEHYVPFLNDGTGKPLIWNNLTITYGYDETVAQNTDLQAFKTSFGNAFGQWAKGYKFNFVEMPDVTKANIKIGFRRGDHSSTDPEDTNKFDGRGRKTAHAYTPPYGILHFDADEKWSYDPKDGEMDVESIALHELGHALGLDHSEDYEAAMFSFLSPGMTKRELTKDDIDGINFIYNTGATVTPQ